MINRKKLVFAVVHEMALLFTITDGYFPPYTTYWAARLIQSCSEGFIPESTYPKEEDELEIRNPISEVGHSVVKRKLVFTETFVFFFFFLKGPIFFTVKPCKYLFDQVLATSIVTTACSKHTQKSHFLINYHMT